MSDVVLSCIMMLCIYIFIYLYIYSSVVMHIYISILLYIVYTPVDALSTCTPRLD